MRNRIALGAALGLLLGAPLVASEPPEPPPGVAAVPVAVAPGAETPETPIHDAASLTEAAFLAPLDGWAEGSPEEAATLPAVAALLEDLEVARAREVAAATLDNPEISLAYEGSGAAAEEPQTDLVVSWQPPRPDRRRLERQAAGAGVAAARARLAQDLAELRRAWRRDYARWAVATRRLQYLEAHGERLQDLAERAARRAAVGEDSGLEARRLALAAAAVEAERARAEAQRLEARAAVEVWRPDLPADAAPALPPLPAPPLTDAEAGFRPPALAAAEVELRQARLEAEAAERVLGMPRFGVGWQRQEVAGRDVDRPLVGVSWSLPVLDRDRPRRMAARARVESLEARVELLRRRLEVERTAAREAYEGLRLAARRGEEAVLAGPPAVDAATAAFAAGELELTALLETLAADRGARSAALDLAAEALAAHRRLEVLRGTAPDRPEMIESHDVPETSTALQGDSP